MIPATVPPFPFYIINKDIIKGSFPFRKTFHTPKPDFATRFRPPRVFRRPEEPKQNHGNGTNRRRKKFSSPENTPIQRLFYLCPRRLQNPIPDIAVRSVRKSAFKPLRHRYCQVNPPAERLKNTHGNICNQVTSVDEFRCFSAFCA